MERVIKDYCDAGLEMRSYSAIWLMHHENLTSEKGLEW